MVSMLASSVVDRLFKSDRVKPKTMQLVFVASLLRNIKEKEQTLVGSESGLGDMYIRGLLFQWTSTIKIQQSMLV